MPKKEFQDEIDVLKYQRVKLSSLTDDYSDINNELDELEKKLVNFMANKNINKVKIEKKVNEQLSSLESIQPLEILNQEKDFNNLLMEANDKGFKDINLYDIATSQEILETNNMLKTYYREFTDQYKLDKFDYAISGIIGTIAALMDYFLVTQVNGESVTPGKLKSGVEEFWNKLLSEKKIADLEDKYKVSYDVSSNTSKISQQVLGLCPLYHRFQSLGHDPILGFVFGVADLMKGQLTAIDGNGRLIIQNVQGAETKGFIEAVITVFGHFLSDVGTKSDGGKILSVPAPLTPLLQLVQAGSIEYKGTKLTVTDLSKKMFYDGYNFNHFIGMSLPVLLIEVLTRLSFVIKEMFYDKNDVQFRNNPKLTVMLCIANGILFSENVGKLAITKNPFSINYVSWISTARYGFKTLKWVVYDREIGMIDHAQGYIDINWQYLMESADDQENNISTYYIE